MTCPSCEYNKQRAAIWRAEAYKQAGHDVIQRPWIGLTAEDRNDCLVEADPCECLATPEAEELMRVVETKLKEKNT